MYFVVLSQSHRHFLLFLQKTKTKTVQQIYLLRQSSNPSSESANMNNILLRNSIQKKCDNNNGSDDEDKQKTTSAYLSNYSPCHQQRRPSHLFSTSSLKYAFVFWFHLWEKLNIEAHIVSTFSSAATLITTLKVAIAGDRRQVPKKIIHRHKWIIAENSLIKHHW